MDRTAYETIVDTWVAAFGAALDRHDIDRVLDLFEPEGFWRDLSALTWNVYTAEGGDAIRAMLSACLEGIAPTAWNIGQLLGSNNGVHQALLSFETRTACCSAVLRLRGGRCWTLLTAVSELIGFEETTPHAAPTARRCDTNLGGPTGERSGTAGRPNLASHSSPIGIVGAGQAGLGLGARLKNFGVPTLIVDKRERPSDTLARALRDALAALARVVRPHAILAVPRDVATLRIQGPGGRLARCLCNHHGSGHLDRRRLHRVTI